MPSSFRSVLVVLCLVGCHGHFFEVVAPFFSLAAAPQHIPSWTRLPCTADARIAWIRHRVFVFDRLADARSPQSGSRSGKNAESMGHRRLTSRGEGPAASLQAGPMQPHFCLFSPLIDVCCFIHKDSASPFRLHRHFGPRPASLGAAVMGKVVGTVPFCRARSEAGWLR